MAIPDFFTFTNSNVNATAARKVELKNAFAKQIGWTAKVDDGLGKEIDNPITFQEAFNDGVWQYIRQTCVAGQIQLDKEVANPVDDFEDLVA